jgi:hypothetical protein
MTNKDASGILKTEAISHVIPEVREALWMGANALEQEPCEDTISRRAVLDRMQMRMSGKELYKAVYDLPSVTPKQRTGRWVESYINQIKECDNIGHFYVCTECGRYINLRQGEKLSDYPYCHCGAKMVEPQEVRKYEN